MSLATKVTLLAQRIGAEIKAIYASKGAANGIATLGGDGKVPAAQLPASTGGGGGATTLDGLTDATIASPADGQVLKYDAASSQWKNAAAPAATVDVSPSGLYWRFYVTAAQVGTSIFIGEATLRTSPLGAQVATGGTAFGSHNISIFGPDKAFNGVINTNDGYFASSLPAVVGYQFAATTALVEVVVTNVYSSATSSLGSSPKDFLIQYSTDNVNWTTALTVTGESWTSYGQSKTYTLSTTSVPLALSNLPGTSIVSPSDGQLLKYDAASGKWKNATAISPFGKRDTVPVLSNFTWVNQSVALASQEEFGISMEAMGGGADNNMLLVQAVPAGAYTVTARLSMLLAMKNYSSIGLCWYDSVSGKVQTLAPAIDLGAQVQQRFRFIYWNSPTSYNGDPVASQPGMASMPAWHRLRDDGTNRYYEISADGVRWSTLFTLARTIFLTPTHVGFFINPLQTVTPYLKESLTVHSWKVE